MIEMESRTGRGGHRGRRVGLLTPLLGLAHPGHAWGDHGGAVTPVGGFSFGWLVVGGAVLALGLALWALFAPERDEDPGGTERDQRT